jgi:tRNA pseudouridine55 synthase
MTEPRRRTPRRKVNGVLLLDKPTGLSSNTALQRAKRLFEAEKAGHTGTLDPFASGLLPVCLGEATKFSQFLLDADKVYRAEIRLGVRTTTADPEGEVIETKPVAVTVEQVRAVLPRFLGEIMQVPPMHSALKRDGRPLYEYARQGIELERPPRAVQVHELTFESLAGEVLTLVVHCGKGLYVRTLAEDIGAALGCGAYLQALRRLKVGPFSLDQAVGLAELEVLDLAGRDAQLQPEAILVADLARLELDLDAAWQICHGQPIWRPGLAVGERFALFDPAARFLGVAEVNPDGKLAPRRLLAT